MNTNAVPGLDIPGLNLLPHSWQGPIVIVTVLLPIAGRAWHAFTGGGGAKGIWNAVIFGTNTPKPTVTPQTKP